MARNATSASIAAPSRHGGHSAPSADESAARYLDALNEADCDATGRPAPKPAGFLSALAATRPTCGVVASAPTSLKREPPAPLELAVPKSVRLSLDAAAAASSAAALVTSGRASAAPAPAPATVRPAAPVVAWRAQPGPALPPRVAVVSFDALEAGDTA